MPPRSRRQQRIRPISQRRKFKTRRERIQHLWRMQDVARIRVEMAIEKAEKDTEKIKIQIGNLQKTELTPEEFEKRLKGLKTKIDNLRKNIIDAQKRAREWRDLLREEGEEIEEPIIVEIVKSLKTLYICWEWYTGATYSSLAQFITEEALPNDNAEWTDEAGEDIDEQISIYIEDHIQEILQEIVDTDNAQGGTLSTKGISDYWNDPIKSANGGKTRFVIAITKIINNDNLAEKNGFTRKEYQYIEE